MAAAHGSVRLLVEYGDIDLGRVEPKALWEDLKTARLLDDVERVALVADQGWLAQPLTSELISGVLTPSHQLDR